MVKVFEILEQIMSETAKGLSRALPPDGAPPQMVLAQEATVAGFEKVFSDLQRLRELAKSPRLESWLANNRDRNCRDGGSISTLVELLDLLRSMA